MFFSIRWTVSLSQLCVEISVEARVLRFIMYYVTTNGLRSLSTDTLIQNCNLFFMK